MARESIIRVIPGFLDALDRLIDVADDVGARTGQPDGFRREIIAFRLRAYEAFQGGDRMATRKSIAELAAVADDVRTEVGEWVEGLEKARGALDRFIEASGASEE